MSVSQLWKSLMVACLLVMTIMGQMVLADPCQQGHQLFLENNYLAAEPLLHKCLEQDESLLALLPLTMMTVIQQRTAEGLDFGVRALALAPDNVSVRYWYGRALLQAGREDEAGEQWEHGVTLDAGHAGILEGLARLSLQKGQPVKAYNLMRQMLLQGIDEAWLHHTLAELAQRLGHWEQAAAHWRDVIDREGPSEENILVLGELLILAGKSNQAVEHFRNAIVSLPTAAVYGGLGEAWFTLDQLDSAVVSFQKAVALDSEEPRHYFNLANALQLLERHEEAGQQFIAYLGRRPDDPVGRFHYGIHLLHRGQMQDAMKQLEKAVKGDAGYIQARIVLAQLYQDLGQADAALSLLDELVVLDPDFSEELDQWRSEVQEDLASVASARDQGKVHLMHIVVADSDVAAAVSKELSQGIDFDELATRFSLGPTAVRGGDIGWINPADMTPLLRQAIEKLVPGETTPPIETGGQIHFFKRIR